jgi:hypothetical protein
MLAENTSGLCSDNYNNCTHSCVANSYADSNNYVKCSDQCQNNMATCSQNLNSYPYNSIKNSVTASLNILNSHNNTTNNDVDSNSVNAAPTINIIEPKPHVIPQSYFVPPTTRSNEPIICPPHNSMPECARLGQ